MLRTKHKQNCSFESQNSYSHSVTLASLSSHNPSSSHPHSVILCHTVIYFPIRTVSLCHTVLYLPIHTVSLSVITQSFSFPFTPFHSLPSHSLEYLKNPFTQCHSLLSHSHLLIHTVSLCHHTVLHLPIHTV